MNKSPNPHQTFLQFMLRAQHLSKHDARSDKGYAMVMTSILSIIMLSVLAAYLTMSNLSKSASVAYTKSNSTFYAAESGLNARAQLIRNKVGSFDVPSGLSATSIDQCLSASSRSVIQYTSSFGTNAVNDFGCKQYKFDSTSGTASDRLTASGEGSFAVRRVETPDSYIATTYIKDNPDSLPAYPKQAIIPTGQLFAGMNMLEYTQRVYSTATIENYGKYSRKDCTAVRFSDTVCTPIPICGILRARLRAKSWSSNEPQWTCS